MSNNSYRFLVCADRESVFEAYAAEIQELSDALEESIALSPIYAPLNADHYGSVFLSVIQSMVVAGSSMVHIATEIVAKYVYREVFDISGEIEYGGNYYRAVELASRHVRELVELGHSASKKAEEMMKARNIALDNMVVKSA